MSAFGSLADMSQCNRHVRFTPKADMCSATRYVCFGPEADVDTNLGFVFVIFRNF
jgi:hypothetical protein